MLKIKAILFPEIKELTELMIFLLGMLLNSVVNR